jgi:hypothetical protein
MERPDVDLFSDLVENLHKAAHMGPLERVEEADIHIDFSLDLLGFAGFVQNGYRVFQTLYADLFNVDIPFVF